MTNILYISTLILLLACNKKRENINRELNSISTHIAIAASNNCENALLRLIKNLSLTSPFKEKLKLLIDNKEISKIDFLQNLDDICAEDDGVYKNCDELFTKDGTYLSFLLIPKVGSENWYKNESKKLKGEIFEVDNALIKKIKNIKKADLSLNFDVWVFYTNKRYTTYVGMDTPYNLKTPRIVELYYLKSGKNNWEKQEIFEVKNEKDESKENKWRRDFIDKAIKKSNENPVNNTKSTEPKISSKWDGKYSTFLSYGKIGGDNASWILEIEIKKGLIKATGEGYQISFSDLLSGSENGNTLLLRHLKNISGYKLGKKMNPEFTLVEEKGKFYIKSDWIDKDIITKPKKYGYEISKE